RWPPGVRREGKSPLSAQFRTVAGCTPRISAACRKLTHSDSPISLHSNYHKIHPGIIALSREHIATENKNPGVLMGNRDCEPCILSAYRREPNTTGKLICCPSRQTVKLTVCPGLVLIAK